ncbi:hypothetical protein F0P96_08435 [Hymenobacter busanensis]|uniref:Uncharacterized protein n=1 Tax=Hymenobacter busanensis TaxID=2607656 RepID=A0A7L4ZXU1_9BACT|nr:hypothetical protein [Hymenobacter busanensis]KAA9333002.1 hypothetical protein F0P96_08435 [Hymenobacter busanensis]QHJ08324.1 hypothetical protein GUY19_13895 [Hymenobacter busanensis]
MPRLLLLLLGALLVLAEPALALAEAPADAAMATTEAVAAAPDEATSIPRPRYKRYRGNSRRAYRRNVLRRLGAKKTTKTKVKTKAAPRRRGTVTIDEPVRNGVVK